MLKTHGDNMASRKEFVIYWAEYIKNNPEKAWEEHRKLINAMMQSAKHYTLSPQEYLQLKGEASGKH
ncbi:hypothetical protein HYX14_04345 [Candidatus Woesearchaeota archaeon]|nr:hypothetical protein [Candidatus Woesearchaeota archaeon]